MKKNRFILYIIKLYKSDCGLTPCSSVFRTVIFLIISATGISHYLSNATGKSCSLAFDLSQQQLDRYQVLLMRDGWIRRRVIWYLKRDQVTEWRAKRSGECARCGKCCKGCLALDAKGKRCKIYGRRPAICKAFPLTPDDIKRVHTCGYRFQK